ncbi:MAG: TetR/AcrR family transcriptional regulator [Saprospiraceae bacterium]|nr:TetR/AcrR family transcriptional regulator [Saprospiraceae bacterium]
MDIQIQIKMNKALYLRDPMDSDLGKNIISHSILMIDEYGFESFTFKKLAQKIESTEAGIYRYFENKHRLLIYLLDWYWSWLEYLIIFKTNNIDDPSLQLKIIIEILTLDTFKEIKEDQLIDYKILHQIVISEGSKAFLTKNVELDNKQQLFKPYKDLCRHIAGIISEFNPGYPFPRSLATTIIEMSHYQNFFMNNLPSLTDFGEEKDVQAINQFLINLLFSSITKQ